MVVDDVPGLGEAEPLQVQQVVTVEEPQAEQLRRHIQTVDEPEENDRPNRRDRKHRPRGQVTRQAKAHGVDE